MAKLPLSYFISVCGTANETQKTVSELETAQYEIKTLRENVGAQYTERTYSVYVKGETFQTENFYLDVEKNGGIEALRKLPLDTMVEVEDLHPSPCLGIGKEYIFSCEYVKTSLFCCEAKKIEGAIEKPSDGDPYNFFYSYRDPKRLGTKPLNMADNGVKSTVPLLDLIGCNGVMKRG